MCVSQWVGICWVEAGSSLDSIFGFSHFLSALAIFFIVYTVAGERYKFRIAVAPFPLHKFSFWAIGLIGLGVLISEIWVNQAWLTPRFNFSQSMWQGLLGLFLLILIFLWMWFGFISPPKFSRFNSRRYANELYHYTLEGKESSSGEIMYEISNSIERIVEATSSIKGQKKATEYQAYAYDIILMLGDKRLCKVAATSHPVLIIKLFDALNTTNIAKLPISDFCRNVSTSLIVSDESLLRYESDFISSGLLGELKPLSKAMFGNMQKLECLGVNFGSPLDLQFSRGKLSGIQLETYCRCLSVAVDSYLSDELWKQHSYVLNRAFHFLDSQTFGIHEINLNPDGYFELEAYKRFETVADFLTTLLNALDERKGIEGIVRYCRESHIDKQSNSKDIFDLLAELAFELSHKSAYINVRSDVCWWVQHNIIWAPLVSDIRQGSARTMVLEKYFGLLEKEIFWREGWLNFKSARLLGFSLNMLGVSLEENTEGKPYHQFRSRILEWSKSHYETVRKNQFDVADAVLFGSITYEEGYLVKTYAKGLKSKAPYELLELDDHE